ncbi:recombinase family protein [Streptomyces sp. NPDC047968]|uniref:recombinase family protein n=1 Tax=unclassified Streptomyces TaxID=2593676 RepID=UPI00342C0B77
MARLTGYASPGVLNPAEARGLRQATSRMLSGKATKPEACRWLNSSGYRTARGGEFRPETLGRILSNPRMAGLDADLNPIEDFGETVLTVDEFNRLMALWAEQSSEQPEAREAYEYLLTEGISGCGRCLHSMTGARVTGQAPPSYRCPPPIPGRDSCGGVRINADRLEDPVAEQVLADLMRPGAHDRVVQLQADVKAEVVRLRDYVANADERFKDLGEMHGRGLLVKSAFLAAQEATKKDLKDARTRLRFLEQIAEVPIAGVTDFVKWWKSAPRASQRALIALEVKRVLVMPSGGGRHKDPYARISIDWRTPSI